MATVGSLVINLIANTGRFTRGMRKSREQMEQFSRTFVGQSQMVGKVGAQMATGIATATGLATIAISRKVIALQRLTEQLTISADAMVKQSRTVGLFAQQYKELRYAAEQSGASTEQFNTSISYLVRNIGQGIKAFEKIGLSIENLRMMDTHTQFLEVADAISKVKNRADQAAVAYEIFGRGGMAMLETVRLGKTGLAEMAAEQQNLSRVITAGMEIEIAAGKAAIDRHAEAKRGLQDRWAAENKHWTDAVNNFKIWTINAKNWVLDLVAVKGSYVEIEAAAARVADAEERLSRNTQIHAKAAQDGAAAKAAAWTREVSSLEKMRDTLAKQVAGWDDISIAISNIRSPNAQYQQEMQDRAQGLADDIRHYRKIIDEQNQAGQTPEVAAALGPASALEISRHVSVAGMSMGGMVDKQDRANSLLSSMDKKLSEIGAKLTMN